jgi:hypothetical protein
MTEPARDNGQPTASDHRWLVLVIVAIAQLMVVLDATIVNIALPSAQHALGFPNSGRQWVVTAYAPGLRRPAAARRPDRRLHRAQAGLHHRPARLRRRLGAGRPGA